ncbi:MAG: serpin family protein [Bacteroidales bacterium]|nr:serpin family protein [Bacteroidales bacterium]
MKNLLSVFAAAAIALVAASCNPSVNNPYKALEIPTKATEFVEKGHDFSLEFIDRINDVEKKDFIVSPLSMQFLLGMILNGAQGATADEICDVLGYGAGEIEDVNQFCQSMLAQLPKLDKQTTLSIANAIFVDEGWPLLDSYKSTVGKAYNAKLSNLDFSKGAASAKVINRWCSDQTHGMIDKVLETTDPAMLCYLLNALYFKSQWKEKFNKSNTAEETFTDEAGNKSTVKMMKQNESFSYQHNDVFKIVRMPYGNGAFSMVALLPQEGKTIADALDEIKESGWRETLLSMVHCDVDLWLPRFETKYHINLNDILSDMGMPTSFTNSADFKAMSDYALKLSFVQQDAVIKVDEEGTEAAAISMAGMMKDAAAAPGERVVFHADHPFLYFITEASTGAILFAGRYSNK